MKPTHVDVVPEAEANHVVLTEVPIEAPIEAAEEAELELEADPPRLPNVWYAKITLKPSQPGRYFGSIVSDPRTMNH